MTSPPRQPASASDFILEIALSVIIVASVVVYAIGKRENGRIANLWRAQFEPVLSGQFAACGLVGKNEGDEKEETSSTERGFTRESGHVYHYYCSGRRHCRSVLFTLNLQKRQDLFSVIQNAFMPCDDQLSVEAVLCDPEHMDPFVCAVVPKRDRRRMLAEASPYPDVRTHATQLKCFGKGKELQLPANTVLFGDSEEACDAVLSQRLLTTLAMPGHAELFHSLHISDCNVTQCVGYPEGETPRKVVRFTFTIPPCAAAASTDGMANQLEKLVLLTLHTIDHVVATVKLSSAVRKRITERRAEKSSRALKSEHDQRQERASELKAGKRQREKDEYTNMTSDQKLKYDTKQAKKNAKAKKNKFRTKNK
jgi:hypothetical protein